MQSAAEHFAINTDIGHKLCGYIRWIRCSFAMHVYEMLVFGFIACVEVVQIFESYMIYSTFVLWGKANKILNIFDNINPYFDFYQKT